MNAEDRAELLRRLKSIEGHIRGITRMVEEDRPCMAVLQQIRAVQGSLKQIQLLLLRQHLDACLCDLATQDRVQFLRDELVSLFDFELMSSLQKPQRTQRTRRLSR